MIIPENYNKVQINFSVDRTPDGKEFKNSLLISIREDDVKKAVQLYNELKDQLNNENNGNSPHIGPVRQNRALTASDNLKCECGKDMILREGRNGFFFGCESYPSCRNTKPAGGKPLVKKNKEAIRQNSKGPIPDCPKHGVHMYLRSRSSDGVLFWGCSQYQKNGCTETLPYLSAKKEEKIPTIVY